MSCLDNTRYTRDVTATRYKRKLFSDQKRKTAPRNPCKTFGRVSTAIAWGRLGFKTFLLKSFDTSLTKWKESIRYFSSAKYVFFIYTKDPNAYLLCM